jgi:hypothetical protein
VPWYRSTSAPQAHFRAARGHSANRAAEFERHCGSNMHHQALDVAIARLLTLPTRRRRRMQSRHCSRMLEASNRNRLRCVFRHDKSGRSLANHSRRKLHEVKAPPWVLRPGPPRGQDLVPLDLTSLSLARAHACRPSSSRSARIPDQASLTCLSAALSRTRSGTP